MGPICRLEQRNHFHFHHQETKLRSPPCTCGGRWCLYSCCPSIFCCVAHSLVSKHLLCFSFFFLEALSGFSYFPSLASHFVSGGFLVVYRSTLASINPLCLCPPSLSGLDLQLFFFPLIMFIMHLRYVVGVIIIL